MGGMQRGGSDGRGLVVAARPRGRAAGTAATELVGRRAGGLRALPARSPSDDAPCLFAQVGQSLDGRIATASGDATAISGPDGLRHLHRCRALADAVVVGVRTALADDPRLTVRLVPRRQARPASSSTRAAGCPTTPGRWPPTAPAGSWSRPATARGRAGVEIVRLPADDGWISPLAIADALAERGLRRVLIEGGGVTIGRFLDAGLLFRLHVAIAPLIIGAGPAGLRTSPIARLADALRPETHVYGLDSDVIFDCALGRRQQVDVADGAAPDAALAASRA